MSDGEPTTKIVRPLRSGQITIPAEFRKRLGIDEHSLLQVSLTQDELRLKPVRLEEQGSSWFRELYDLFAPVRQEAADKGYTEEQINAWIDDAVRAARAERAAQQP
ncbi:MAG TPA: AbrB/MazE/SpoVT family DNA-binding domain-containing protein [Thermomicrobiales bacterium]|jgi:AbrB family looped-hinge helix DNA binding protein